MTPPTKAVQYIPPGQRRRPRSLALTTYRLSLTRETDGAIVQEWSRIPHDKVAAMLRAMQHYSPWLVKVAQAKEAWAKLMDLFS